MIRTGEATGDAAGAAGKMQDARLNVRAMLRKLERIVSDELAAL